MGLGVGIICKQNLQRLKDGDGDGLKHHTTISSQFNVLGTSKLQRFQSFLESKVLYCT